MHNKKSQEITIRRATHKDIEDLIPLHKKIADHHRALNSMWQPGSIVIQSLRPYLRKELKRKNARTYVALHGNKIIGYCMGDIRKTSRAYHYKKMGYISSAFILPQFRRNGIMTILMNEFFKWFKKRNLPYVHLTVDARNPQGLAAWSKIGFREYLKSMRRPL